MFDCQTVVISNIFRILAEIFTVVHDIGDKLFAENKIVNTGDNWSPVTLLIPGLT